MSQAWLHRTKGIRLAPFAVFVSVTGASFGAQGPPADSAQTFPTRPIRMIVAFPPGGGNDILARFVGARLTARLGQQIVNDNRGGASGIIGTEIVARAAPDGHTVLFASVTHTMNEAIRKVPYDTLGSFAPIALLGRGPNVLVANPGLPARTLPELIALAKNSPGKINYASTGVAGMHHFGGELFKRLAGIDLAHVAYKGGGPAARVASEQRGEQVSSGREKLSGTAAGPAADHFAIRGALRRNTVTVW